MFLTPERRTNESGDAHYYIAIAKPLPMGCRFELNREKTVIPCKDCQPQFKSLQDKILSELTNHKQLFKNPPSLESLEAITPNWGCIVADNEYVWNKYTAISTNDIGIDQVPGYVDVSLVGIFLSRSTISPQFNAIYLEKMAETAIEFDWNIRAPELEEVSDIVSPTEGTVELRDPAVRRREKIEQKNKIREALRTASTAKEEAIRLAQSFLQEYDISDNESTFTEWMEDVSEDESL